MAQRAVKTKRRVELLDSILSVMEDHELFNGIVNIQNNTEAQIRQAIFLRLQEKLPACLESSFKYSPKKAKEITDQKFAWEQNVNITVSNFPFFATNHRPDAQLEVDNLRIGIEIKKGDSGQEIRSGIGQSIVYSTQFDFVLYFFVDISNGGDIKSSLSGYKEAQLINSLWEYFNIRFKVV